MELTQAQERLLRRGFRFLNKNMLLMWRLGLGRYLASPRMGYIMVLGTTGRKSGVWRLAPLDFAERPDRIYCLAGCGRTTHWLLNLQADPACEVWLPDGRRLEGSGVVVEDEEQRVELVREVLVRSGFAAAVAHPGLDLATATDEEIASLGMRPDIGYQVVEIKLGQPVTGPGGPGDLAWAGPIIGLGAFATLLVGWRILRRR